MLRAVEASAWVLFCTLMLASPTSAQTYSLSSTGTVAANSFDGLGLFGPVGGNLAGSPYSLTLTFNTAQWTDFSAPGLTTNLWNADGSHSAIVTATVNNITVNYTPAPYPSGQNLFYENLYLYNGLTQQGINQDQINGEIYGDQVPGGGIGTLGYIGIFATSPFLASVSPSQSLDVHAGDPNIPLFAQFAKYDPSGTSNTFFNGIPDHVILNAPVASLPQITPNLLLASVAGATNNPPSTGQALGDVITYYRNNPYASLNDAISDCIDHNNPPGCKEEDIYTLQQTGFIKFSAEAGLTGANINTAAQGFAIGAVNVDTSAFDASLLGQILGFKGLVDKVKSSLTDAIDFFKALTQPVSSQSLTASVAGARDPIIVNSLSGKIYWDNDGQTSWELSDLALNVDIPKDYSDIVVGQQFATTDSLISGASGFGVFSVDSVVDPPGYNTAQITFRHIDYIQTVPEPATLALFGSGLAGAMAIRRRRSKLHQAENSAIG